MTTESRGSDLLPYRFPRVLSTPFSLTPVPARRATLTDVSHDSLPAEVTLSHSGHVAKLVNDPFRRRGVILSVDGVAQSQVNLDDPTDLAFDYIQRMANVVDTFRPPSEPISALHLGAGALTLPRYILQTRPGSTQRVIEWELEIVNLVRRFLPWDDRAISIDVADARSALTATDQVTGAEDLIVVDLFSGNHTPSHLTTLEFYALLPARLTPEGVVVANVVDGADHQFVRSQCRTLREIFGFVAATGEANVVKGRLLGNLVIVATQASHTPSWWAEVGAMGPHPTGTIEGRKMEAFIAGQAVQIDAGPLPSPTLSRSVH